MVLDERRKALEDQFFQKENAKYLERIRQQQQKHDAKKALEEVSGITDDGLLEVLVATGISADTLTAVSLVPLVEVAWADGKVQDNERNAIMKAAEHKGIATGSGPHELLADWLTHKPQPELMATWKAYVKELLQELSDQQRIILAHQVTGRAKAVAEAAGGLLGFKTVSKAEQTVLADIEAALGAP